MESELRIDYKLSMPENQSKKKDGTAADDQKERGYYYDDAHGYENYEPEEEEEEQCEEPSVEPIEEAGASRIAV